MPPVLTRLSVDPAFRARLPLLMIAFPGVLFAMKYGPRADIPAAAGLAGYLVFFALHVSVAYWLVARLDAIPGKGRRSRVLLLAGVFAYALALLALYSRIDPTALQIDRWSALSHFWDAIFRGEYPYRARTHLDSFISGFPGLFLAALPFRLLGDVGLMQFAALAAYAVLALRACGRASSGALVLILLAGLPVFVYEVIVRSELFSNMVMAAWLLHAGTLPSARRGTGPLLALALGWGLLLSTRGVVIVPFVLAVFPLLRERRRNDKVLFGTVLLAAFAATFVPFFVWDPVHFLDKNPLHVQASYIPSWALAAVILASMVTGYRHRARPRLFAHTGFLLFTTVLFCWLLSAGRNGMATVLWEHGFDLTYFALPIPFILLHIGVLHTSSRRSGTSDG